MYLSSHGSYGLDLLFSLDDILNPASIPWDEHHHESPKMKGIGILGCTPIRIPNQRAPNQQAKPLVEKMPIQVLVSMFHG